MKFYFLILIFFVCSCSNIQEVSIPADVLPIEKMSDVMLDVLLIESSMNVSGSNAHRVNVALSTIPLSLDLFKNNKITKTQFDKSYKFYCLNPQLLIEIYQNVLNDLSKMQAEVNNKK